MLLYEPYSRLVGTMPDKTRRGKRSLEGMISARQCRAARAAMAISQADLAEAASVARGTVQDFERGTHLPHTNHLTAIRVALERMGVRFIEREDSLDGLQFPPDLPEPPPE